MNYKADLLCTIKMLILNAFFACGFTPVSFGFSAVFYLHVVTLRREGNPLSLIKEKTLRTPVFLGSSYTHRHY